MQRPVLSIIIPTHQRSDDLFRLLNSINDQDFEGNRFEVIVVSNLKDPELGKQIRTRKDLRYRVRYFEVGKLGVNLARNLGIENSQGSLVYFLDDDCVLDDPKTFSNVVRLHDQWKGVVGIGGRYHIDRGAAHVDQVYQWIQDLWLQSGIRTAPETIYLIGGNASYKKEALGEELRFDERIVYGGSETELNLRLIQKGFRLRFSCDLKVLHCPKTTLIGLLRKGFKQGISAAKRKEVGLVVPLKQRPLSREFVALQFIPDLKFWVRFRTYWTLSLFDYFFALGMKWDHTKGPVALGTGSMILEMAKAPNLKWFFKFFSIVMKEELHLSKYGRYLSNIRQESEIELEREVQLSSQNQMINS